MRIVTTMMVNLFKEFLDMAEARPDSLNSSHSVLKFKSEYYKPKNLNWDRFVKQRRPGVELLEAGQLDESSSQGDDSTHLRNYSEFPNGSTLAI